MNPRVRLGDMVPRVCLAELYDVENCPRDDGGRLHDRGEIVDYPGESPAQFFQCTQCHKMWTVIELRRKTRTTPFRTRP